MTESVEDGTEGGYTAYPAGYHQPWCNIQKGGACSCPNGVYERTEGTQRYIDSGEYEGEYKQVNRVEVIDSTGRAYMEWDVRDVRVVLQDGGHTLKVFLVNTPPEPVCSGCLNQGGFIIADLTCPVHGLNGTDPGDGPR